MNDKDSLRPKNGSGAEEKDGEGDSFTSHPGPVPPQLAPNFLTLEDGSEE